MNACEGFCFYFKMGETIAGSQTEDRENTAPLTPHPVSFIHILSYLDPKVVFCLSLLGYIRVVPLSNQYVYILCHLRHLSEFMNSHSETALMRTKPRKRVSSAIHITGTQLIFAEQTSLDSRVFLKAIISSAYITVRIACYFPILNLRFPEGRRQSSAHLFSPQTFSNPWQKK